MVRVMTRNEMEAKQALFEGSTSVPELDYPATEVGKREKPFADLRKLSNDELLDRLDQIDKQATLIKWRIWWEIRSRFKSDKLFGQYIVELRNDPTHANLVGSQQDINRFANAGKFCETYRITDLNKVGLLVSSVYELSRPKNESVARQVYQDIKNKGYSNIDVIRRIEAAKAIEQEPVISAFTEPKNAPETHGKAYYSVEKSVATLDKDRTWTETAISFETEELDLIHNVIKEGEAEQEEAYQPSIEIEATIPALVPTMTIALTERGDAEVIADIKKLIGEQVSDRLPIKTIGIYRQLIEWMEGEVRVLQTKAYPPR